MNYTLLAVILVYFAVVIGVGYYYYNKSSNLSDYILGGRSLNPYVTALSAQASDMSSWLLMGLPGAIMIAGLGEVWLGIGLAIGTYLSWLFVAKRLRVYTEVSKNSLTLSTFFSNRFRDEKGYLRDISAVIILVFFTVYVASGFVGAGKVFNLVFDEVSSTVAIIIAGAVIVIYTFLGGFKAVCWTDFLQGMLMILALVIVPVAAIYTLGGWGGVTHIWDTVTSIDTSNFTNLFYDKGDRIKIVTIFSLLAWGLGYFGMPHVIIRYTAIKKPNDLKVARRVAMIWLIICLAATTLVGLVGRAWVDGGYGSLIDGDAETIFIAMAGGLFAIVIAGVIYSAILAAVMSTADSQLLVASSAISNDLYKRFAKEGKELSDGQLIWLSRGVVALIAVIAALLALSGNNSIMELVSYAWAGFGAAFGPLVICALYYKKANTNGALAGMLAGFITVVFWNTCMVSNGIIGGGSLMIFDTGIYELIPGFLISLILIIVVSHLTGGPEEEVLEEYATFEKEMEKLSQ